MEPDEQTELAEFQASDLDAHGGYGTGIDRLDEPLILYPARSNSVEALNKRFVVILPLYLLLSVAFFFLMPSNSWFIIGSIIALIFLYFQLRRKYLRATVSAMEMRPDGVLIHSYQFSTFIPWPEIKEIFVFDFVVRHIGIVPYDIKSTLATASLYNKIWIGLNNIATTFYATMGIKTAPLFVLESELQLSAEDVVELMNRRRAHALGLDQTGQSIAP